MPIGGEPIRCLGGSGGLPPPGKVDFMSRLKRPSPALVVAVFALVAAIAVPAFALTKGEKRVVRKVAKFQANKRITQRAPALNVNNSRTTDEVHRSARVRANDPVPGDMGVQVSNLLTAGAFTIKGDCSQDFGGGSADDASFSIEGPGNSSISGLRSSPTVPSEVNSPSVAGLGFVVVESTGNEVGSMHFVAVAPNGQIVSVIGSAEVNDPAGDCVFGVTAVGP